MEATEPTVSVFVPIKTKNPTNNREDWYIVARRMKQEHNAVWLALASVDKATRYELGQGCVITLTRHSSGRLDAIDGLGPALKGVKDAVASWLIGGKPGEKDEDERLTWELRQEKCGRGRFGVTIDLRVR